MLIRSTVTVNLKKLKRFESEVNSGFKVGATGPIRKAIKQWGIRYRAFLQQRYLKFSQGGGNWPPLKPSTIKRRRKQSSAILFDTGTMFGAFEPVFQNKPGQLNKEIDFGVLVGVGGDFSSHPTAHGVTLKELIIIHHFGLGVVPARIIVVPPSSRLIGDMVGDMSRALRGMVDG